jgi:phage head maturation protease
VGRPHRGRPRLCHAAVQHCRDVAPVWQRVADGTLQSVSIGYRVHRYEPRPDAATGQTVHRAVDWEPYEISVMAVPVDGLGCREVGIEFVLDRESQRAPRPARAAWGARPHGVVCFTW